MTVGTSSATWDQQALLSTPTRTETFHEDDFHELVSDSDNTVSDAPPALGGASYRNRYSTGARDQFSHERDLPLQGRLPGSDFTRSVSALSLDAPTFTNLSDSGRFTSYGSTGALHSNQPGANTFLGMHSRGSEHMPSHNAYEQLPSSFQAASFTSNSGHGVQGLGSSRQGVGDSFSNVLTEWQQRHQRQLERQQLECQLVIVFLVLFLFSFSNEKKLQKLDQVFF